MLTRGLKQIYKVNNTRLLSSSADDVIKYLSQKPYVLPNHKKILASSMVYISGEEMTRYTVMINSILKFNQSIIN